MKLKSIKRKNKMHNNPFRAKVIDSRKVSRNQKGCMVYISDCLNFSRDQRWDKR